MSRALLLLLVGVGLLSACASLPQPRPAWERWSMRQGGLVDPAEEGQVVASAEAALARLAGACACPHVRVRVLNNERSEAFAWRDGSLFVTRGLVRLLAPEELAATLAHELGHLLAGGAARSGPAAELTADRLGTELLVASGLNREHMLSMLERIVSATAPEPGIEARIAALRPEPFHALIAAVH
jgi:predicted Zn-dependent protease